MRISIIVAVAENGVIGRDGKLPWHLADDLRRFKQLTMGHTLVLGRRTWESIGRPLPGRHMIVVSRQTDYPIEARGVEVARSFDEAVRRAEAMGENEAFVIGGAALYLEALPLADRLYATRVRATVVGDTYLPEIVWHKWRLVESEHYETNGKNEHAFDFQIYQRIDTSVE